jgi:hypothetical protein
VPRPSSSTITRELRVADLRIDAVSSISAMNVEMPLGVKSRCNESNHDGSALMLPYSGDGD